MPAKGISSVRMGPTGQHSFLNTDFKMKIFMNRQAIEVEAPVTLAELLRQQQLPAQGIAVALDNKVVPKTEWESTLLQDQCSVTVIRAVCGG